MSSYSDSISKEKHNKWKIGVAALLLAAISCLLFGLCLRFIIIPNVVKSMIIKNTQLVEGSRMWNKWTHPEYKLTLSVFVHSVKNPDQILNGEKPVIASSGPYVFDKKVENEVLSHKNGIVKFKRHDYKFFNESKSCQTCILGNRVWIPNLIYQKFVEAASTEGMKAATTALLTQTAFLEVDIGELLFDGYKDPFLDPICEIPFMNLICESILDVPDRIGLMYGTNGTADGEYEIYDGVNNPKDLGRVVRWNGEDHVDATWWSADEARKIRGTEGNLFPPFLTKDDKLYVFITQLCRSVYLVFKEEIVYKDVPAYRFVLPADVFDQSLPENKGFCNPTPKVFYDSQNDTGCWPKGLLEISNCQQGKPPIVISLPNFHYAPNEVFESVVGLNLSNPNTDEILVDIEPRLGAVLHARRVYQINIEMWKGKEITFPVNLRKMHSSIVPVITAYEVAHVDEETFNTIKNELIGLTSLAYTCSTIILWLSVPFMLFGLSLCLWKSHIIRNPFAQRRREHVVAPLPEYKPNSNYPPEPFA